VAWSIFATVCGEADDVVGTIGVTVGTIGIREGVKGVIGVIGADDVTGVSGGVTACVSDTGCV
jgi:hypothetical protein